MALFVTGHEQTVRGVQMDSGVVAPDGTTRAPEKDIASAVQRLALRAPTQGAAEPALRRPPEARPLPDGLCHLRTRARRARVADGGRGKRGPWCLAKIDGSAVRGHGSAFAESDPCCFHPPDTLRRRCIGTFRRGTVRDAYQW